MNSDPHIQLPISSRRRGAAKAPTHLRLEMKSAGATNRGKERSTNEDRFLIHTLPREGIPSAAERVHLFAVADGVGGARGGETASALAVQTLERSSLPSLRLLGAEHPTDRARIYEELRALFREADRRLAEEVARRPELRGMATTLTA